MNNDIIKQSLVEAFEILKDSWKMKSEAIVNCIVETEVYDGELAIDMWLYILQNNTDDTNCLYSVLSRFDKKYSKYSLKEYLCKTILEHIALHVKNDTLVSTIFGKVITAGDCELKDDNSNYFLPALGASLLLVDNPPIAASLIKSMSENSNLSDVEIVRLLTVSKYYVEAVLNNSSAFDKEYKVTDSVKEALFSSIGMIQDKGARAECTVAILSM